MAIPYSQTHTFTLGDSKFYCFSAGDSHGSRSAYFSVNGESCSSSEFMRECLIALGDGAFVIHNLFSVELDLGQVGASLPAGRVDFTVKGCTYGLTIANSRPTWTDMTINGQPVGFQDFCRAVVTACRPVAKLIGPYLRGLKFPTAHETTAA
jgi:hypothetical protein